MSSSRASSSIEDNEQWATPTSPTNLAFHPGVLAVPGGPQAINNDFEGDEVIGGSRTTSAQHVDTDAGYHERLERAKRLPWWKRPSPWWLIALIPLQGAIFAGTLAPRVEVYTRLACSVHRPDISGAYGMGPPLSLVGNGGKGEPETCASDPVVQAAVARLTTVIATTTGILSCLTTGWWSSLSDRHGRLKVMGIATLGQFATDFGLIVTTLYMSRLPGGYWFLVVGPCIEGLLGSLITVQAASTAYISDMTSEADRSRLLSLSMGLLFSGVAVGPWLGSLLIRFTGHTLSVFYISVLSQPFFVFLILCVFPESLLESQMVLARRKFDDETKKAEADNQSRSVVVGLRRRTKKVDMGFLGPLAVLVADGRKGELRERRDWNLLALVASYGIALMIGGAYTYKFQYAQATFGWGSEEIGYWLSVIGITRGIFMTFIFPVVIKLLKPKPYIIEVAIDSATPTTDADETQPLFSNSTPRTIRKEIHSPSFDMSLCRISLFIELVGYAILALSADQKVFAISGVISAFGAGYAPALQSVALAMYMRKGGFETGKLLGAVGVIQSLCGQIIGPALYGVIYMSTVGTHPRAIFWVSVLIVLTSFFCLALVRVPKLRPEERRFLCDEEDAEARSIVIEDIRSGG